MVFRSEWPIAEMCCSHQNLDQYRSLRKTIFSHLSTVHPVCVNLLTCWLASTLCNKISGYADFSEFYRIKWTWIWTWLMLRVAVPVWRLPSLLAQPRRRMLHADAHTLHLGGLHPHPHAPGLPGGGGRRRTGGLCSGWGSRDTLSKKIDPSRNESSLFPLPS